MNPNQLNIEALMVPKPEGLARSCREYDCPSHHEPASQSQLPGQWFAQANHREHDDQGDTELINGSNAGSRGHL